MYILRHEDEEAIEEKRGSFPVKPVPATAMQNDSEANNA